MATREFLVVAAIDFGTTYSGYAFSMLHEYKKDPCRCSTFTWTAASGGLQSLKCSTCILFDKDQKFEAFGFHAEDKYSDLALENKHHGWYFFRRFKMQLYNRLGIKRDFTLEADNGKTMKAMTVFSKVIECLKEHLVDKCKKQQTNIDDDDILFVLTVPAIWTDSAKQFMREAAEKAEIKRKNLVLALEPEAASLFCKHVPIEKIVFGADAGKIGAFTPGAKYIVLDAGGGTIDITVHAVQKTGKLREIQKANGGDWGGTCVDEAFINLLVDIVGRDVMDHFSKQHKYDMLDLMRDFEVKKRTITPEGKGKITFKVPIALNESFRKYNKKDIKDALPSMEKYNEKVIWMGDKMRLDAEFAKSLYKESTEHIVTHLKDLTRKPDAAEASYILMVGGYSESPMLSEAINNAFPDKRVLVPSEAGLSVLKGAVIFGHEPRTIEYRVCKYTYGISTSVVFFDEIHDKSKMIVTNCGQKRCIDIFDKHVEIGEEVEVGMPQNEQFYGVREPDQDGMTLEIYISEEKSPMYVTDKGCKYLGEIDIEMPGYGIERSISASMSFSGTELHVEATDNQTGELTRARFNLLQ